MKNDIQLESAEWYCEQADKLISEYHNCRTAHAQQKLLPKIKHIRNKLNFEKRQMIQFGYIEEL